MDENIVLGEVQRALDELLAAVQSKDVGASQQAQVRFSSALDEMWQAHQDGKAQIGAPTTFQLMRRGVASAFPNKIAKRKWSELARELDNMQKLLDKVLSPPPKDTVEASREWIPPQEWLETLDSEARTKADSMIAMLSQLGASDPVAWVSSEMREGFAQVARFLVLRQIREVMDTVLFCDSEEARRVGASLERTLDLQRIEQEGATAFKRLVESGSDVTDILKVSRLVNVRAVLKLVDILDEGYEPLLEDVAPEWALMETDSEGKPTGRFVDALHESLLSVFEGDEELQ
jgi:hypothetical protein